VPTKLSSGRKATPGWVSAAPTSVFTYYFVGLCFLPFPPERLPCLACGSGGLPSFFLHRRQHHEEENIE
jgi:hypothetical protein